MSGGRTVTTVRPPHTGAPAGGTAGYLRTSVIVVQAPTCTRSPSLSGTGTNGWIGSSAPLIVVPLVESWSTTDQEPSGCCTSSACWCDTPGSSGGRPRSMSGASPVDARRRPIVTCGPVSGSCCSAPYAGRLSDAASGPLRCIIAAKYSRSGPIIAVQAPPRAPYSGAGGIPW